MDYDPLDDTFEPDDPDYADDEEFRARRRRTQVTVRLSWQQVAFILSLNAIISLIVSLAVVILAGPRLPFQPAALNPPGIAAADTGQAPDGDQPGAGGPAAAGAAVTPGGPIPTAQPVPAGGGAPAAPATYIVEPGDTLGSIAAKFEIPLEDLMRANGLDNPDYVQVEQQLIIPVGGLPSATPTFTPVPIPTDTPLPFNPPTPLPSDAALPAEPAATVGPTPTPVPTLPSAAGSAVRLAVQVLNPGNLQSESVQIVNQGPFVRLTGWKLLDEDGNVYSFPDFSLWGGGAINVHTAGGANTTTDLYWGQPAAVWASGELATLRDAEGNVMVTQMVPVP
jgi:hypothetical protein